MKYLTHLRSIFSSFFLAFSSLWLIVEIYNCFSQKNLVISFTSFTVLGVIISIVLFLLDGFFILGFLRKKIIITTKAFNTKINIFFGDLLKESGWKAIAVNDFFDFLIDDKHIAKNSLHGKVLLNNWGPENLENWYKSVCRDIDDSNYEIVNRESGNIKRFQIGTTAAINKGMQNFLFSAFTHTDIETLEVRATIADIEKVFDGIFKKARSVCANTTLNVPMIGSGLSRTSISPNVLINIIIFTIFKNSKNGEITSNINIVLPVNMKKEINLVMIKELWG